MRFAASLASVFLVTGFAFLTVPAWADESASDDEVFPGLADNAAGLDRLHSLVIAVDGEPVFSRVFRGPGLDEPANASDRVSEVTISHLLSMQAGLQRTSGRYYGEWVNSDNWVDYALSRPFVAVLV